MGSSRCKPRIAEHQQRYAGWLQLIAFGLTFFSSYPPAIAQPVRSPTEPDYTTIKSGRCEVNICTDFDFGSHVFRMYAAGRPHTLKVIPRGACTCKSVQRAGRDFNDHLRFGIETPEGRFVPSISLSRIWPPGHPRARSVPTEGPPSLADQQSETTFEEFQRLESELEATENFFWDGDRFETYRVLQTKSAFGGGARRYFFVPKVPVELEIGSSRQQIAFATPLARRLDSPKVVADGPTVSAAFRFSNSIQFFQFFTPRLVHSDNWIPDLDKTARFLGARLHPNPASRGEPTRTGTP